MSTPATRLGRLREKYDRPAPRYTSYPPAPWFHEGVGASDYGKALAGLASAGVDSNAPLELYAHVPFCEHRCTYCGCHVIPTTHRDIATRYVDALIAECELVRSTAGARLPVTSIHLGGGTPTYLSGSELGRLFRAARSSFTFADDAEIAIEIDPRVTTDEHFAALRSEGVTRVSLGVQDASDAVQRLIGRNQSWTDTAWCFDACRGLGVKSINIDLVYGLPGQTLERFDETLSRVVALGPDRLAVFGYAHVPWVRSHQKRIDATTLPSSAERLQLANHARERLADAGYVDIGLDHFARDDDELATAQRARALGRTFMGYTRSMDASVIGLGISSIGETPVGYFQNVKKLSDYFRRLERGELPVEKGWLLSEDDRIRRHAIRQILCNLSLRWSDFAGRFGIDLEGYFPDAFDELRAMEADGLVALWPGEVRVTRIGRPFLRNVAMLFDAYADARPEGAPRYSQTV